MCCETGEAMSALLSHPLGTSLLSVVMCAIFIVSNITGYNIFTICLHPASLLSDPHHNLYRLLSAPFFHLSLIHLVMNLMAHLSLSLALERKTGTLLYLYNIFLFSVSTTSLQYGIAYLVFYFSSNGTYLAECSAGFSGVLFALLVFDCSQEGALFNRSIFGMFPVSNKLYPWVLLAVIQIIWPGVSFLGHLSGILIGYLCIISSTILTCF
eukprot:TRINITY_DN4243_c0_g1_i2.p1 TRINITY_DN4243_c0_g1~~TRINITY_DN4243_c0_g1_i2.p1  ORF type:complete len:211 (+),score=33.15 TRINITY_DN4243_c0_g1_i2:38-670(+)